MLIGGTVNKEIFQIERKLLRIPTDGRLTSWLFTQHGRRGEFSIIKNKNPVRVEVLNQGLQYFKFSALNCQPKWHQFEMEKYIYFGPFLLKAI